MGRIALDPAERYWPKVDVRGPDECWPWTAAVFDRGYGAFRLGNRQTKAHRFAYELAHGPIPDGLYVCHSCDNPLCQNPGHLFLGTHKDNADDRETKRRGRYGRDNGYVRHARFSDDDIRAIRAAHAGGEYQKDIAARYGVEQTMVSGIVRRTKYAYVT